MKPTLILALVGLLPTLVPADAVTTLDSPPLVTGNVREWRTLAYGPRQVGAGATSDASAQTYDLALPAEKGKVKADAPVFLFVHGGAWAIGKKEHGDGIARTMAQAGFVAVSMNYALHKFDTNDGINFDVMLRDIDAMVSHLKGLLPGLGVTKTKRIVIGGASAGGHLSLAYAYDETNPSALGLALKHELTVGCVYSDCGPSDLASPEFMLACVEGLRTPPQTWNARLNALAGGKYGDKDDACLRRMRKYSPVNLVNQKSPPTVCLYGKTGDTKGDAVKGLPDLGPVGTDGIVAVQNFDVLTNRLSACRVPYAQKLTKYPHCQALGREPKLSEWLVKSINDCLKPAKR